MLNYIISRSRNQTFDIPPYPGFVIIFVMFKMNFIYLIHIMKFFDLICRCYLIDS